MGAYGSHWQDVQVAAVNVYIDDSGTAPDQRIAVASALIIPASRMGLLENEWARFREKYGIGDKGWHSSECAAQNRKFYSADWDDEKLTNAFDRVAEITMKYGVKALSFAIRKADYDELMPEKWKDVSGFLHYTWAIAHVLKHIQNWRQETDPSHEIEYFFDWEDGESKNEIEKLMGQQESLRPGEYEGHFSFRKRKEIPALQCVDLLAWTSLSRAREFWEATPMNSHAERVRVRFARYREQKWILSGSSRREDLAESIRKFLVNALPEDEKREWYRLHEKDCREGRTLS